MNKLWRQLLFKGNKSPTFEALGLGSAGLFVSYGLSDVNPGNLNFVVVFVFYCCINKLPAKLSSLNE